MERIIFQYRATLVGVFVLLTVLMAGLATQLQVSAGLAEKLPQQHRYLKNAARHAAYSEPVQIMIALSIDKDQRSTIFTPDFFAALREIHVALQAMPDIDKASMDSILRAEDYPPDILPRDHALVAEDLEKLHSHFINTGHPGRLIAQDFSATLIIINVAKTANPRRLIDELRHFARTFEQKHTTANFRLHMVGKPLLSAAIADDNRGALWVLPGIIFLMGVLVYFYADSLILAFIPWGCALMAAIWQLSLIWLFGFKLTPLLTMAPLFAFLMVLVHGLQLLNSVKIEVFTGALDIVKISQTSFRRLWLSGLLIPLSHAAAFGLLLLIEIPLIWQFAIVMLVGLILVLLINLLLMPVLLSYAPMNTTYRQQTLTRARRQMRFWETLARFAHLRPAYILLTLVIAASAYGYWQVPALSTNHADNIFALKSSTRYQADTELIAQRFDVVFNKLSVLLSVEPCEKFQDVFEALTVEVERVPGIQTTLVELENPPADACVERPVQIIFGDNPPGALETLFTALKKFEADQSQARVTLTPFGGNISIPAALNESLSPWYPLLNLCLVGVLFGLMAVGFRSLVVALCIVIPAGFAAALSHVFFVTSGVGLTLFTLPMFLVGLAANIGYGMYLFCRLRVYENRERGFQSNYLEVLESVGGATIFGGFAWSLSMVTLWFFAPLQWVTLTSLVMSVTTFCGLIVALLLSPALAAVLWRTAQKNTI